MAKRNRLSIDIMSHINDVIFVVYRADSPGVSMSDTKVMEVEQVLAIKERREEINEVLNRSVDVPYAFLTKRHYEVDQKIPNVRVGTKAVDSEFLFFMPGEKQIELHSGDMGIYDGRLITADYEYLTIDVQDGYLIENGKSYYGPPATGLHIPLNVSIEHDSSIGKLIIRYNISAIDREYWYRIYAIDTSGNISPWSKEESIVLKPNEVLFRIQRSPNGEDWEEVAFTSMKTWLEKLCATDAPEPLKNVRITPKSSKETWIEFDNPFYVYQDDIRQSYTYRIRTEDDEGEYTEWIYLESFEMYIKPKNVLVRRSLYNGAASSKDGIDAFSVFNLDETFLRKQGPIVKLIDDQLTEGRIYGYTLFYTDELDDEAIPVYLPSDNRDWENVILFKKQKKEKEMLFNNFLVSFELADNLIEIGQKEGMH